MSDGTYIALIIYPVCSVAIFLILIYGDFGKHAYIDYEAQANCIAEYDYTHPKQSKMDNLVKALEECR